jgi:hypothetical protein
METTANPVRTEKPAFEGELEKTALDLIPRFLDIFDQIPGFDEAYNEAKKAQTKSEQQDPRVHHVTPDSAFDNDYFVAFDDDNISYQVRYLKDEKKVLEVSTPKVVFKSEYLELLIRQTRMIPNPQADPSDKRECIPVIDNNRVVLNYMYDCMEGTDNYYNGEVLYDDFTQDSPTQNHYFKYLSEERFRNDLDAMTMANNTCDMLQLKYSPQD